jgi:hypothetical protein
MARIKTQVFNRKMRALKGTKKNVMQQAFAFFKSITPIATGFARKNTRLINNNIVANYPYASILDKGRHMTRRGLRGSEQAPDGMSQPTIAKFGEWVRKFIRGI